MLIRTLADLPERSEQAIIINVGTKLVSTLSLASALRFTGMPVLVIDCQLPESDGSFEHFKELNARFEFDLMQAPLRRHSAALDVIFREVPASKVLLVDSDVEILNADLFALMRQFIDDERVFGAGLIEGPNWMSNQTGFARHGYFEERMWIPLTMLNVAPVRMALDEGHSFGERQVFNDFAPSTFVSRIMGSLRYRYPSFAKRRLRWLDPFRESHHGEKPWLVWHDTGSELYRHLKYSVGDQFVGLPAGFHSRYAKHFSGVTNNKLNPGRELGTALVDVEIYVRERLSELYGIEMA
ncbi:MAG: hypothetical protein ABI882_07625 [Acidobacteriota bacterium]